MRSIWKGLRDTGIIIGTAAAVAGLTVAQNPEVLAPLAASFGPYGTVALFVIPWAARAAIDAIKHRGE